MRDFLNKLGTAQTAAAATVTTTNSIAIGGAGFDIGVMAETIGILFTITADAVSAAAEEYVFNAIAASDEALTTGIAILGSIVFPTALAATELKVGQQVFVPIAPGRILPSSTHIGGSVVAVGAASSVGFTAELVPVSSVQGWKAYDGAVTEI